MTGRERIAMKVDPEVWRGQMSSHLGYEMTKARQEESLRVADIAIAFIRKAGWQKVPEWWVVVPMTSTPKMRDAVKSDMALGNAGDVWTTFLAAAPEPPEER